jgi:hypothetical protein
MFKNRFISYRSQILSQKRLEGLIQIYTYIIYMDMKTQTFSLASVSRSTGSLKMYFILQLQGNKQTGIFYPLY